MTKSGLCDLKYRNLNKQDIERLEQASKSIFSKVKQNHLASKNFINGLRVSDGRANVFFDIDTHVDCDDLNKNLVIDVYTFHANKNLTNLFKDEIATLKEIRLKFLSLYA